MSFTASITNHENQNIWFRTVNVLSSLHEDIKFTITSNELIAWCMNATDTSLCQVRFDRTFFDDYEFKANEIIFGERGLQVVNDIKGDYHRLYSFQTNGRHLSMISKKPDSDVIKKISIKINNTSTCPEALANRLLVFVDMESLITKEYSPQFQPIKYDPIIINLKYKKKFLDVFSTAPTPDEPLDPKLVDVFVNTERQISNALFNLNVDSGVKDKGKLTAADEINYLCCHQALLRNFIENCNTNVTEELKLEININRLIITAFTKAIYGKNNDLLRNAISMSNTISTQSLEHYCLFTTYDEEENTSRKRKNSTKCILFKLKDFKNFINITVSAKSNTSNNENMNIWFCHPGDPILMELTKPGVKLELVQVTDGNQSMSGKPIEIPVKENMSPQKNEINIRKGANNNSMSVLSGFSPLKSNSNILGLSMAHPSPQISKVSKNPDKSSIMKKLFVSEFSQELNDNEAIIDNLVSLDAKPTLDIYNTHDVKNDNRITAERSTTTIGWGKRHGKTQNEEEIVKARLILDSKDLLKNEKLNYFTEMKNLDEDDKESTKSDSEIGLGPTQQTNTKGLFD